MEELCQRISAGELVEYVAADLDIDSRRIRQWANDPEFAPMYARAREDQANAMADQVIAIADGRDIDSQKRLAAMVESIQNVDDDDKDRLLNALAMAAVQRDKLRLDARKWMTAKVYPKVYGERQQIEHSGEQKIEITVNVSKEGRRITAG